MVGRQWRTDRSRQRCIPCAAIKPIGRLLVHRGIETFGANGDSLVKGVVVSLSAIALSIKPGGSAREIDIQGGIVTHGKDIPPLEVHGAIGTLRLDGVTAAAK
jgi:hypothetical protein